MEKTFQFLNSMAAVQRHTMFMEMLTVFGKPLRYCFITGKCCFRLLNTTTIRVLPDGLLKEAGII